MATGAEVGCTIREATYLDCACGMMHSHAIVEKMIALLPFGNGKRLDLLANKRMLAQLPNLERHTGGKGRDTIDYAKLAAVNGAGTSRRFGPSSKATWRQRS